MREVTAFAPASVANVGCGFDIMGFALRGIGDRVTIRLAGDSESSLLETAGTFGRFVPSEIDRNTSGVAVKEYLSATGNSSKNVRMMLEKNLPLGSGLGSSAASAAAALVAVNRLFGDPLSKEQLIRFAMEGERTASGAAHADNAAPSILGGFNLIRSHNPPDIIHIDCPAELFCVVVHPHIEVKTSDARRILRHDFPLEDVTRQSANSAAFVTGLLKGDYDLISRSLNDFLAEPRRTKLIPGYAEAKRAALNSGAIGCGISGSGPSVFALCRGEDSAGRISLSIRESFLGAGLDSDIFFSSLNEPGAYIVSETEQ